jgi:UDP-sugar transporter A1/2/3
LFIVQYDSCKGSALLPAWTYLALLLSLFVSSSTGVWNEHLLKTSNTSMHAQNCFMYAFGVIFNLCVFFFYDESGASFFHGYNVAAVGIIFCQAVLGLVVAAVLKYADTVVRSLATACSISLLYAVNVVFLGWRMNLTYVAGCCVVFVSTYLYTQLAESVPESDVGSEPSTRRPSVLVTCGVLVGLAVFVYTTLS